MKGLVVDAAAAWRRFFAATSAHSASKGSFVPPRDGELIDADPNDSAREWRGGPLRTLWGAGRIAGTVSDGSDTGTELVTVPSHCSGFGKLFDAGTGST